MRTLSVLSLVTAVSRAVVATHQVTAPDGDVSAGAAGPPRSAGSPGSATEALALRLPSGAGAPGQQAAVLGGARSAVPISSAVPITSAAAQAQVQSTALGHQRRARALHSRALAEAERKAEREAKARAKARAQRLERAQRSAARDPQSVARMMLADRGWGSQFGCLESLWSKESGWNHRAMNASSGAYGIPQALPGSKMASAGADWRTNPVTQIRWGLDYIADRYGSPCAAWGHSQASNWY